MTQLPLSVRDLPVEVRRSRRRTRTVSASVRDGRLVVLVPATMSRAEEAEWVEKMRQRLDRRRRRPRGDAELERRAAALSKAFLPGAPVPASVRWVTNQSGRWGSCTPTTGEIRISHTVGVLPAWVQDYVLLHELAHLIVAGHGPRFWALLDAYPQHERARGYLEGYAAATGMRPAPDDGESGDAAPADGVPDHGTPNGSGGPGQREDDEEDAGEQLAETDVHRP